MNRDRRLSGVKRQSIVVAGSVISGRRRLFIAIHPSNVVLEALVSLLNAVAVKLVSTLMYIKCYLTLIQGRCDSKSFVHENRRYCRRTS